MYNFDMFHPSLSMLQHVPNTYTLQVRIVRMATAMNIGGPLMHAKCHHMYAPRTMMECAATGRIPSTRCLFARAGRIFSRELTEFLPPLLPSCSTMALPPIQFRCISCIERTFISHEESCMVADVVDASFSSPLPLSECGPLWLDESNFGQDQCIAGIRRKYVWQLMQWRTKRKTRVTVGTFGCSDT